MISLACLAMEIVAENKVARVDNEVVVIWDLGGIHFDLSKFWFGVETAKNIGWSIVPLMAVDHKIPSSNLFFDALKKFPLEPEEGFKCTYSASGTPLPYVLCAYQAGKISSAEVLKMARETLPELRLKGDLVSQRHQHVVQSGLETIFNPAKQANLTSAYPEGIALLKEIHSLKMSGKKIKQVALSNWDSESFSLVKARFAEEMALFDDIIISGDIGTIKPNDAAFEAVLKKHGYDKKKYIFIDDQKENIEAAKAFGIENSLLFTVGDYYTLRKQLNALGVLSVMPEQKIITKGVKIASVLAVAGVALLWFS